MSEELLAPGTPVNLDNCHREPIRTPGGVQSHGVLLAARADTLEIVQISENAPKLLGRGLLARPVRSGLGHRRHKRRYGDASAESGRLWACG